jgi:hypothetical protein
VLANHAHLAQVVRDIHLRAQHPAILGALIASPVLLGTKVGLLLLSVALKTAKHPRTVAMAALILGPETALLPARR